MWVLEKEKEKEIEFEFEKKRKAQKEKDGGSKWKRVTDRQTGKSQVGNKIKWERKCLFNTSAL